jgi:hypothetical protein
MDVIGWLGIALPILAHLLNRHEVRRTDWAAMQFLNRNVRVRSRQIRLHDLLLLCLTLPGASPSRLCPRPTCLEK